MREGLLRWYGHVLRRSLDALIRRCETIAMKALKEGGRPKINWRKFSQRIYNFFGFMLWLSKRWGKIEGKLCRRYLFVEKKCFNRFLFIILRFSRSCLAFQRFIRIYCCVRIPKCLFTHLILQSKCQIFFRKCCVCRVGVGWGGGCAACLITSNIKKMQFYYIEVYQLMDWVVAGGKHGTYEKCREVQTSSWLSISYLCILVDKAIS